MRKLFKSSFFSRDDRAGGRENEASAMSEIAHDKHQNKAEGGRTIKAIFFFGDSSAMLLDKNPGRRVFEMSCLIFRSVR